MSNNDSYWNEAYVALRNFGAQASKILAPEGFEEYMTAVHLYKSDENIAFYIDDIEYALIHKDHVDTLPLSGLAEMIVDSDLVFANAVFCIFKLSNISRRKEPHVASFLNRIRSRTDSNIYDSLSRKNSNSIYLGDYTAIVRTIFGHKLFVDTRDISLTPHLLLDGTWEAEIAEVIRRTIRTGMVVVEVGTNCGFYSLLVSDRIGHHGRFYGFEANPRMCRLAMQSLEINGFRERAIIHNKAASNRNGRASFQILANHMGSGMLGRPDEAAAALDDTVSSIDIETVILDDELKDLDSVDFVKIDAEGHEQQIIEGMENIITRSPNIVLVVEFIRSNFVDERSAAAYLDAYRGYGFNLRRVASGGSIEDVDVETIVSTPQSELFLSRE